MLFQAKQLQCQSAVTEVPKVPGLPRCPLIGYTPGPCAHLLQIIPKWLVEDVETVEPTQKGDVCFVTGFCIWKKLYLLPSPSDLCSAASYSKF